MILYRPKLKTGITRGLIAAFNFEDNSSLGKDSIAGINTCITSGATQNTTGKVGSASSFNGTSNSFFAEDSAVNIGGGANQIISVSCWVNVTSSHLQRPFVTKLGADGNREFSLHYLNSSNRFQWNIFADGTNVVSRTATAFGAPTTGVWYHVAAGYSGTQTWIQINGGYRDVTSHTTGIFDGTARFRIGGRDDTAAWMHGLIDCVGIWKRHLTVREVQYLYRAGIGRQFPYK